ncbi:nucleoside phosphorylase [Ruminiclostridium josui]|uniref:nucleoside phosphorylase n=1 Tax=Ruminiclostridium josui TaxID=1499 RepID=UPI00046447F2|nr:nucleoside phosphorylase [Ruminiclostridium josui]
MEQICPLHEYDNTREAYIEPSMGRNIYLEETIPSSAVFTFSGKLIEQLSKLESVKKIGYIETQIEKSDIFKSEYAGKPFAFSQMPVGAAAAAIKLERLIALGVNKIIVFGSAGVLNHEISAGNILIPVSAVRDEGTSYHYLPPSREIEMNQEVVNSIVEILEKHHIHYKKCKTWTTDAIFRETEKKVAKRKSEGCLTVDMECSALLAISEFRKIKYGQLLYAQDSLGSIKWDPRDNWVMMESHLAIEKMFFLAAEIATNL